MPLAEIAQALGINENAVKNTIFRAVQKVRRALEPVIGDLR
jgi:DNA-directed RNA polymerase specialized sigma24 family protein